MQETHGRKIFRKARISTSSVFPPPTSMSSQPAGSKTSWLRCCVMRRSTPRRSSSTGSKRQCACRAQDGCDPVRLDGRWAGGCPFAGQPKAAGNICTEELVLLCEEMGIDTGVDLDALIEVGRWAEEIVGHQLPSELIYTGSLDACRRLAAA